jgi:hypothetical protein
MSFCLFYFPFRDAPCQGNGQDRTYNGINANFLPARRQRLLISRLEIYSGTCFRIYINKCTDTFVQGTQVVPDFPFHWPGRIDPFCGPQRSIAAKNSLVPKAGLELTTIDSYSDPWHPTSGFSSGPLTIEQVPVKAPLGYRFMNDSPMSFLRSKENCATRTYPVLGRHSVTFPVFNVTLTCVGPP